MICMAFSRAQVKKAADAGFDLQNPGQREISGTRWAILQYREVVAA
ncbi:MAG: hypothetical protein RR075_01160 [Pygmaiobacter sp.]